MGGGAVSRADLDYRASTPVAPRDGVREDRPVAGFYRAKLRSGAHPVGVEIFHGPPFDPVTGEELDRSHRWQARVNGQLVEIDTVWPRCGGEPIGEAEYRYLTDLAAWARDNAPGSPQANPRRRIDPLTAPMPF